MRTATSAERAEVARQIDAVRRATERYRDIENAKNDGYAPFGKEAPLMGEHWYHKAVKEPPEGTPVDLEHPGTLQYATTRIACSPCTTASFPPHQLERIGSMTEMMM